MGIRERLASLRGKTREKCILLMILYGVLSLLLWIVFCVIPAESSGTGITSPWVVFPVIQLLTGFILFGYVCACFRAELRDRQQRAEQLCESLGIRPEREQSVSDCIRGYFDDCTGRLEKAEHLLSDFAPVLREHALLTVMNAEPFTEVERSSVDTVLNELGITDDSHCRFAVLCVRLEAISTLKLELHQNIYSQFRKIIQFSCADVIPSPYRAHFVWSDHSVLSAVFCIPGDKTAQAGGEDMISVAQKLQEQITLLSEAPVIISFSDVCDSVEGLSLCYQHAGSLMRYKLFYQKDTPYTYTRYKAETLQLSYDRQKGLTDQIRAGKFREPCEILESYFASLHNSTDTRLEETKKIAVDLIDSILNSVSSDEYPVKDTVGSREEIENGIMSCETVHEVADRVIGTVRKASDYMQHELHSRKTDRVRDIKDWIESNYNRDISLNEIAQQMKLSTAYASRLIRESTGMSIPSYINAVRLEHAKLLLVNTNISCAEIGRKVGFNNPQSFIRTFNKHLGMTPGLYRETNGSS